MKEIFLVMAETSYCYDYELHSQANCVIACSTRELALNELNKCVQNDTEDEECDEDGYIVRSASYFKIEMDEQQRKCWEKHPEAVMLQQSGDDLDGDTVVYYVQSVRFVSE